LLYTDGLVEARNPAGELFSFERLQALMASSAGVSQAAESAQRFGQEDDITILAFTRLAAGKAIGIQKTSSELAEA
jgi:serine phosphatase RsbU (regulator of sigma subunit)